MQYERRIDGEIRSKLINKQKRRLEGFLNENSNYVSEYEEIVDAYISSVGTKGEVVYARLVDSGILGGKEASKLLGSALAEVVHYTVERLSLRELLSRAEMAWMTPVTFEAINRNNKLWAESKKFDVTRLYKRAYMSKNLYNKLIGDLDNLYSTIESINRELVERPDEIVKILIETAERKGLEEALKDESINAAYRKIFPTNQSYATYSQKLGEMWDNYDKTIINFLQLVLPIDTKAKLEEIGAIRDDEDDKKSNEVGNAVLECVKFAIEESEPINNMSHKIETQYIERKILSDNFPYEEHAN